MGEFPAAGPPKLKFIRQVASFPLLSWLLCVITDRLTTFAMVGRHFWLEADAKKKTEALSGDYGV